MVRFKPHPAADNPVLTGGDVTDYGTVDYVADPFMTRKDGTWHLFFEVFNHRRVPDAVIGHATSTDGIEWEYDQVVMELSVHASFPYVFEWNDEVYLLPETNRPEEIIPLTLYRARSFPNDWRKIEEIVIQDKHGIDDSVVFRWNGLWWALLGDQRVNDGIYLYYSAELERSNWTPHPENPVVSNRPHAVRPAGRPLLRNNRPVVFYQDCARKYGHKVRMYRIVELSTETYVERECENSPILTATSHSIGWNSGYMHHIDVHSTVDTLCAVVDGNVGFGEQVFPDQWSIGVYYATIE